MFCQKCYFGVKHYENQIIWHGNTSTEKREKKLKHHCEKSSKRLTCSSAGEGISRGSGNDSE